ncbi:hypothetical protein KSP40_PGU021719 [Platanthera guangdongensis]|uniref:Uncharacterized protein n=1 Tax=Platanthera guangdongensis TaxID=2320717 RepID=A0ABR2MF56_9ASPA
MPSMHPDNAQWNSDSALILCHSRLWAKSLFGNTCNMSAYCGSAIGLQISDLNSSPRIFLAAAANSKGELLRLGLNSRLFGKERRFGHNIVKKRCKLQSIMKWKHQCLWLEINNFSYQYKTTNF